MEAVMFMFSDRNGASLLSPEPRLDQIAARLKHSSTIELLRLRGRYVDSHSEFDIIEAELNRRHRRENLVYTVLIASVVILISVIVNV
jgi:hypothetical protein